MNTIQFRIRNDELAGRSSLPAVKRSVSWPADLLDTVARKMGTLSSVCSSWIALWKDGNDPRLMDHHERRTYLELRRALNWKRNLVVYDIGASVGTFAHFVARVRTVGRVYCFEPVGHIYEKLMFNTRDIPKIECFRLALGEGLESPHIHVNEFSASSSLLAMEKTHLEEFPFARCTRDEQVQVSRLDDVVREMQLAPPDFVKIDVQGGEDRVLRGGENTIGKANYCMLELSLTRLYEGSMLMDDLNAYMRDLDFRLVAILNRKVVGGSGEILQLDGLFEKRNSNHGSLTCAVPH